ncbi:MAG: DUF2079 domain-containing protein [Deltaproteobacteria bacterium]|nr:DUF2079 domain-containing protein [Deltaproteobacteria bacterium]
MLLLDGIIYALTSMVVLLLITGGVHYASPTMKLELSQVDAFAISLLALLCIRRSAFKRWLPPRIERSATIAMLIFSRYPLATLAVANLVYVLLMTWSSSCRFDSFHATAFDLSFVDQSLWSTTHVGFLHSSLAKGQSYLGEHFSPVLGLVALVYRLFDSPYFLFLLQSVALASGSLLVYALGVQKKIPRSVAVTAALCFLLFQPLRAANSFDFREDNLFIPIFLGALISLEKKRLTLFWVLCLISWSVKENAPIFTALLGAWLCVDSLRGRMPVSRRWHGVALGLLSFFAFYIINSKITPHFVGSGMGADTMLVKRLRQFGGTNDQILRAILLHPFAFAAEVLRPFFQVKAARYFLDVTAPFLFFVPAAPLPALIVLAGIGMNLLVNQPTIGFHYECILIPFLFYILLAGLATLNSKNKLVGVRVPVLMTLSFLLFFGRSPVDSIRRHWPTAHDRFVSQELLRIPEAASVATQGVLHPHLAHRKDVFLFSAGVPSTDYIVADLSPGIELYATPNLYADLAKIDSAVYSLEFDRDGLKIWHRK